MRERTVSAYQAKAEERVPAALRKFMKKAKGDEEAMRTAQEAQAKRVAALKQQEAEANAKVRLEDPSRAQDTAAINVRTAGLH